MDDEDLLLDQEGASASASLASSSRASPPSYPSLLTLPSEQEAAGPAGGSSLPSPTVPFPRLAGAKTGTTAEDISRFVAQVHGSEGGALPAAQMPATRPAGIFIDTTLPPAPQSPSPSSSTSTGTFSPPQDIR